MADEFDDFALTDRADRLDRSVRTIDRSMRDINRSTAQFGRALSDAYPDSKDKTGKLYAFDLGPVRPLKKPVTLASIKTSGKFETFPLVRMSRLSVMPVTDAEWKAIEKMSEAE